MADLNTTLPTPTCTTSSTTASPHIEVNTENLYVCVHAEVTPVTEDTPDLAECSKFGDVNGDGRRNFDDVKALAGKASDKVEEAADKAKEMAGDAADTLEDMVDSAADKVKETAEKAKDTLSGLKDRLMGSGKEDPTATADSVNSNSSTTSTTSTSTTATSSTTSTTSTSSTSVSSTSTSATTTASTPSRLDFNNDGVVNFQDLVTAATSPIDAASQLFGLKDNPDLGIVSFISGLFSSLIELDRNGDGKVNLDDLRHEFGIMSTSLSSLFASVRDTVNPTQLLSTLGVSSSNNVSLSINSVEEGVLAAKRTLAKTSVDSNSVPVAEDAVDIFGETRSVSDMALSNDPSNDATSKSLFERIVSFTKQVLQFARDLMIPELLIAVLPTIITGVQNLTGNSNFNGLDSLFEALIAFTPEGSANA